MEPDVVVDILTNDASLKFFLAIISAGLVFYVTAKIQNYVFSRLALNRIIGSFRISKNNILRFDTPTGSIDGRIIAIDRKRIEIECEDYIKTIPTHIFADMTWNVIKNVSDKGHLNENSNTIP